MNRLAAAAPRRSCDSPAQVLVASLRSASTRDPTPGLGALVRACDQEELVDLAISEGVAGPASETLGLHLREEPRSRLFSWAHVDLGRHLAHLAVLKRVAAALEQADLTWVVLKGPVLAELAFPGAPHRYTDIDVLVAARDLRRAVAALEGMGATLDGQDWHHMVKVAKGEMSMAVSGSPIIDLHWHLVYLRSARERWRISSEELLERRTRVRLGPVDAWTLDPVDLAAHVTLHASFGAVEQLRRLLDVDRALAHWTPDWELFVRRCHSWRVGLPVATMLSRVSKTLGADVPEEVVRELAKGRLDYLLVRQLSDWRRAGRLPAGRSIKNGLTRSLRDRMSTTAWQFAVEAYGAVLGQPHANRPRSSDAGNGVDDQSEFFARYLEMAERADRYGHLSDEGRQAVPVALRLHAQSALHDVQAGKGP